MEGDYYHILGISRDASTEEVVRAWRSLVLVHHPDKVRAGAGARANASDRTGDRTRSKTPQVQQRDSSASTSPAVVDIRLVNEAKWVLCDAQRRQEWERAFYDKGGPGGPGGRVEFVPREPHITLQVSLEEFTPHYDGGSCWPDASSDSAGNAATSAEQVQVQNIRADEDAQHQDHGPAVEVDGDVDPDTPSYYSYPCRCSSSFIITHQDLEDGVEVVGCTGCGEWVRVMYEVVEELDQDDGRFAP